MVEKNKEMKTSKCKNLYYSQSIFKIQTATCWKSCVEPDQKLIGMISCSFKKSLISLYFAKSCGYKNCHVNVRAIKLTSVLI